MRVTHNIVIGSNPEGEIVVLEETFDHGSLKGATGSIIVPVTQDMINDATEGDAKEEYYEDIWRMDAGSANGTTASLEDWCARFSDEDYLESAFETYTDLDTEDIAEALGESVPERYALIGCGRIFPDALKGLKVLDTEKAREALAAIAEFEV